MMPSPSGGGEVEEGGELPLKELFSDSPAGNARVIEECHQQNKQEVYETILSLRTIPE